jgi:hypothetical protein
MPATKLGAMEPEAPFIALAGIALIGLVVYAIFGVTMILWG